MTTNASSVISQHRQVWESTKSVWKLKVWVNFRVRKSSLKCWNLRNANYFQIYSTYSVQKYELAVKHSNTSELSCSLTLQLSSSAAHSLQQNCHFRSKQKYNFIVEIWERGKALFDPNTNFLLFWMGMMSKPL